MKLVYLVLVPDHPRGAVSHAFFLEGEVAALVFGPAKKFTNYKQALKVKEYLETKGLTPNIQVGKLVS